MKKKWLIRAMLLTTVLGTSQSSARPEPNMVAISAASLLLGSDMAEVIRAAETCARQAEDPKTEACSPERFTGELSSDTPLNVKAFELDRVEVSVGQYERCVRVGRCAAIVDPRRISVFLRDDLPAVFVRHKDAADYCTFRKARLPTEGEFELAMRGAKRRRYPWGGDYHHGLANSGRSGVEVTEARDGYEMLAKVHAFPDGRTPGGALQLSGNAAEWTQTVYHLHGEAPEDGASAQFVVKGGSFMVAPVHLRGAARRALAAGTRAPDVGFRCARDLTPTSSREE